jgi:2-amino-4-hydroxy-6-hydroxymethyldihydropteridine diphosphokinase
MHKCYLSIGSNMGSSAANIESSVALLANNFALDVVAVSKIINTKPYGHIKDQNDFHNACVGIKTWYCPFTVLQICLSIEAAFDRKRVVRWGPRTLDIDILLYDDLIIKTSQLALPHYDMHNRAFVLEPLKQIYQENIESLDHVLEA